MAAARGSLSMNMEYQSACSTVNPALNQPVRDEAEAC
jgi:hypothetical protein